MGKEHQCGPVTPQCLPRQTPWTQGMGMQRAPRGEDCVGGVQGDTPRMSWWTWGASPLWSVGSSECDIQQEQPHPSCASISEIRTAWDQL